MRLIKDDPFATIREMMGTLRIHEDYDQVGWWKIFFVLRKRSLLTRRARFRFARGQR